MQVLMVSLQYCAVIALGDHHVEVLYAIVWYPGSFKCVNRLFFHPKQAAGTRELYQSAVPDKGGIYIEEAGSGCCANSSTNLCWKANEQQLFLL